MCLDLKNGNSRVKTAKEDIVCWKWLTLRKNGKLYSPYQCVRYYLNDEMRDGGRVRKKATFTRGTDITHRLDKGCFHTFKHCSDALFVSVDSDNCETCRQVVVKCIIPKGSKYYEGDFTCWGFETMESYASKELRITDEIHIPGPDSLALQFVNKAETYRKE